MDATEMLSADEARALLGGVTRGEYPLIDDLRADEPDWNRLASRAESVALFAATARLARTVVALHRERDDLRAVLETRDAEHAMLRARVAELEAILAGRTTPPTEADEVAAWSARLAVIRLGIRWYVSDAEGRIRAWPVTP